MIDKDGFCGHCRTYHQPNPMYWNDCPNPHVPVPRARQPSREGISPQRQQALREQSAAEKLSRQLDRDRVERGKDRDTAMFLEAKARRDQQQMAALDEQLDQGRAVSAAAHESRRRQARKKRVGRQLDKRAQEQEQQHAKDQARSQALGERMAAQERRLKARREHG